MRGPGLSVYFLGYVVVEVALLAWFWSAFGAVVAISVLLTGFLLGLLVMRIAGMQAFSALTNAQRRAAAFGVTAPDGQTEVVHGPVRQSDLEQTGRDLGSSALLFVAGLLLASPGLISDAAGLIMLVPVVRRRMAVRLGRGVGQPRAGGPTITVIRGDSSGWQTWTSGDGPSAPADNPPVIRGEILPPPPKDPGQ